MSAAAIRTGMSAASTAAPATTTHVHGAASPLDAIFKTILDGVDSQDIGSQAATRGATGSTNNRAGSSGANPASPTASFEASLLAFDYAGLSDSSVSAKTTVAPTTGSATGARGSRPGRSQAADTSDAATSDAVAALAASAAAASAAPASAAAKPPTASARASSSGSAAVAPLVLRAGGEFAPAMPSQTGVDEPSAANWDLSGATPLKSLLTGDASLGFGKLQANTHLAVAGSATAKATVAAASGTPASGAAATVAAADASHSATSGGGGNSGGGASSKGNGDASDAANPVAAISASAAAVSDPASAAVGSVALPQLADFIAKEAQSLSSGGAKIAAESTTGNAKIKELEINLDPADLGKMSLKLRLSGGKLSVSIGVADPQTLSALQSERGAIESRLSGQSQSLDTLVIHSQEASASDAGTYDSSAFKGSGGGAQSGADSASSQKSSQGSANANPGAAGGGAGGLDDMVV